MREKNRASATAETVGQHSSTRTVLASMGAIGSVLAASSCCLPILPLFLAAGFAGSSAFLMAARPYLLGVSVFVLGYGFYQGWRAKKCRRRTGVISSILLWVAAVFVVTSIFFPQLMANASASLLTR